MSLIRLVHYRLLAVAIAMCGCANSDPYACTAASQCVSSGAPGICANGFCAFSDPACDGGYRYESKAGSGLGGSCVASDAGMPDAPACGGYGEACCATGPACAGGATCQSGTCRSCVAELELGRRFMCTRAVDNTVWCSGENQYGQLGFGLAGVASATPMQVRDSTSNPITDATQLALGRETACVLRANATVWCWGRNAQGQVGNGAALTPTAPPPVPAAVQVVKAASQPLTNITAIEGGYSQMCALDDAGGVWCWGNNTNGQLGDGTTTARSTAAPVLDTVSGPPLTGVLELYGGGERVCVRKAGDEVWCWGKNSNGELGDGTTTMRPNPVLTSLTPGAALGNWYACYLNADTTGSCLGASWHGRFGDGTGDGYSTGNVTTPVTILDSAGATPLTGIVELAAGTNTCARLTDNSVYCWGDNRYGESGTGVSTTLPTRVVRDDGTMLDGATELHVGWAHGCARLASSELVCWGRNADGELGDGTFEHRRFAARLARCP